MYEANLMEQLDLEMSPEIRSVCMQKERMILDLEAVNKMINNYNQELDHLTQPEKDLLRTHIREMERRIQPGKICDFHACFRVSYLILYSI